MMAAVQFICAKIGLVTGRGLAGVMRRNFPQAILLPVGVCARHREHDQRGRGYRRDCGGDQSRGAGDPITAIIVPVALTILALQIWGSYRPIVNVFKWLSLALLAYIGQRLFRAPALAGGAARYVHPHISSANAAYITSIWWRFWARPSRLTCSSGRPIRKWKKTSRWGAPRLWQRRGTTDTELICRLGCEHRHVVLATW